MKRICRTPPEVLLIWQVAIVDASEKKPALLVSPDAKARLAAPITEAQIRPGARVSARAGPGCERFT